MCLPVGPKVSGYGAAMTSNGISAARRSTFRGNELAAMDRLPTPIRRALWESVVDWDPCVVRWHLNQDLKAGLALDEAVAVQIVAIYDDEAEEINRFAHHWPSRFGKYPHVAAEVSIQRYERRSAGR